MRAIEAALLAGAGLLAGGVNAVAGGGSLVSFPALLALGLPPLPANVTNSVALWPGYAGTCWGYRAELRERSRRLLRLVPACLLGSACGCVLLLVSDEDVFSRVVPYLLLLAALLLAVQDRIADRVRSWRGSRSGDRSPLLHVALVGAAAYGAYFGGGLGVVLLACLGVFVSDDLQHLNGLKSALSLVVNGVALVAFAAFGPVDWSAVAVLAPAALVGGYLGAAVARRLSARVLRTAVVVLAVGVALALL